MSSNSSKKNNPSSNCDLFGGMGFLVQFILALICFIVLVVKRLIETPQRPWKIWFLDISKQGVSATVIHSLNLLLAVLLSFKGKSDQCIWYFIGNLTDTTFGVLMCFIFMYFIEKTAQRNGWKSLQSGLYYEIIKKKDKIKTKLNLKMYFSQLLCWTIVVCISKIVLFFIQFIIPSFLEIIGEFILSPLRYNGTLKLVFIMIIIPGILNATQFWIQDNILKFKGNEEISNENLCHMKSETNSEIDSSENTKTDLILEDKNSYDKENNKL